MNESRRRRRGERYGACADDGRCHNGRRIRLHHPEGGVSMPITLTFHVKQFTVTITVKSGNRHSAK